MKIEVRTYKLDIEYREDMCPHMYVEVDVYQPCRSVTPWDAYGGRRLLVMQEVMQDAQVRSVALVTHRRILSPIKGSGPGGRVRFGDDMLPGIYRTAVHKYDVVAAQKAIARYEKEVDDWIHNGGPRPTQYV